MSPQSVFKSKNNEDTENPYNPSFNILKSELHGHESMMHLFSFCTTNPTI